MSRITWNISIGGMEEEKLNRIEEVLDSWQKAVNKKHYEFDGFTFPSDYCHATIGGKYVRFDIGGSGAFMVDIATGTVYGIRAYGKINKDKNIGNVYDQGFNGEVLVRDRFRYGKFANSPDGSIK
jgi:hypothetical protein